MDRVSLERECRSWAGRRERKIPMTMGPRLRVRNVACGKVLRRAIVSIRRWCTWDGVAMMLHFAI